jgi:excisionase family DNA binding protein
MEQGHELLRTGAAAQRLGVSETTLTTWRCNKRYDLPYVKVGSKVYYRRADLDRWLESRVVGGGRRRGR